MADVEVLAVAEGNELVESAEQLVGIAQDFSLVEGLAGASDDLGKEVEGVDILEDVGLLVGDEHHVELVQWLVDKADIVLLDRSMLRSALGKLREGRKQGLYSRSWHLSELSGKDSFTPAGANRRC